MRGTAMREIVTYTYTDWEGNCESVELLREGYEPTVETLKKIHPKYKNIEILETRKLEY
jgi:hypothetical protein